MIKIKNIVAKGYYLFQGRASANSSFIEDLNEAKKFVILANFYFEGYLKIHDYLLTQDGWSFIVRINSVKSISKVVSLESEGELDESQIWRLVSERMRIFLSTFVKFTNKKQRRTGSKVHSSYERFMFETLPEAKAYVEKLRKGMIKHCQSRRKYRAKKSHYRIPTKLGNGSIFLSSRKLRKKMKNCKKRLEEMEVIKGLKVLKIQTFKKDVVRNIVVFTLKHTPKPNSAPL